ncbi:MAG: hypothetical protein ACYS15_06480 [Planctomycetota bacterium]|jgi:hypothetical protein
MASQEVESDSREAPTFREDLRSALQAFRASLIELMASVGADPAKPQDVARRFKLNKNLTWKVSKIATASDLYAAVPHIPGAAGLGIFLRALKRAGAPPQLADATRRAALDFDQVVKVHTGDRATLEIMVNGMLPSAVKSERDEQNRKLAFQGNSATWGVRAKVQLVLNVLAPNPDDPDMADLVQVGGLAGFRRLRRDARWLLFRRERWSDDDPHPARDVAEALDPDFPVDKGVPLLGAFCSRPIPEIRVIPCEGEDQYELPPGPVGNTAAFTCLYGQISRMVGPTYGDHEGELAELGANLITPVEHVLFDLLVHRDLEWAMNPQFVMYSRLDGGGMQSAARRSRNVLPVAETVHDLGWGVDGLATPLVKDHLKLARYVLQRLNWRGEDLRAFRFTMSYPPIPAAAMFLAPLPVRSRDGT